MTADSVKYAKLHKRVQKDNRCFTTDQLLTRSEKARSVEKLAKERAPRKLFIRMAILRKFANF